MILRHLGLAVLLGFVAMPSSAHMRLLDPAPRSEASGLTSPPCGGLPAGDSVASWTLGEEVVVQLATVIFHEGQRIVLSVSTDGIPPRFSKSLCLH